MDDLRLAAGDAVLTVSPGNGGRLAGLSVAGLELLGAGAPHLFGWGCFAMAPYAGRVRHGRLHREGRTHQLPVVFQGHAIHGVTVDRPWEVLDIDRSDASARLRCRFDGRWPWLGHAVQTVRLTGDRLDLTLEVHADDVPMPAWSGFHPWFARRLLARDGTPVGRPVRMDVPATGLLRPDGEGLPTEDVVPVGDGPWDATFAGVRWPATLTWDDALRLTVSADTTWAVVFDERPEAVCVEPQTAPPNAADLTGPGAAPVVEPGTPSVLHMSWHVERL